MLDHQAKARVSAFQFGPAERRCADVLIGLALEEDLAQVGDITSSATIPRDLWGNARFVARAPGVLAGLMVVERLVEQFDVLPRWRPHHADGDRLEHGTLIAEVGGPVRSILALERTALNFLQRLSGIATLTARFVAATHGTSAAIFDTRKTTPGWRILEKYAVRCGGGRNHRLGLHDAVLIKDNHLAALQSQGGLDPITAAIKAARAYAPSGSVVEVEVDTLEQFDRALVSAPDIILVDNLGADALAEAVRRRNQTAPDVELEASGGVTFDTVGALARTGVDRISVGALTHSAAALDIALDLDIDRTS
jgi:nicotinate-nucleotide pyrophosphorylase (carboxylating)